ncbi:hypothetical protein ABVT39_017704 [Epinephelus coioides]
MADSGTSSSSFPPPPPSPLPPIMHHSSLFNSSPPPLSSSSLARNRLQVSSPHLHPQVTSPHLLPQTQVSSPHPQVTAPHLLPQTQVSSPHLRPQVTSPHLPHPQVTAPHLLPQTQVSSPHLLPQTQVSSPHLRPQVTSPHLPHPQVTSPHLLPQTQASSPHLLPQIQVSSPHLLPQTQVTSPHLRPQVTSPHLPHPQVTSPHLLPQTQASSPHLLPQTQVSSPHLRSQVTSPHPPHPQVTSPHLQPQVTTPHLLPQTQASSPHLCPQTHVTSPHPQVTSPHISHPQVTSPHLSHPQVTSPHLSHPQVTSPHLPHPQVTSPHLPHSQVTSPHLPHISHPQVTSYHFPEPRVTSPHLPHPQVTSPHVSHPQVTSPHLPHLYITSLDLLPQTQVSSPHLPHPQITSPHLCPQTQITSPHPQVTSPHLLSLPQHLLSKQTVDVDHPEWSRSEPPAERPYLLTTAHLDHQNQFSTGASHYRPLHNSHIDLAGGVCGQGDTPGPGQDTWRPTLPQGGWSSVDFTSSLAEDFSCTRFFHHSCHDNSSAQPFCSPTTPGLSPHYPQTPTLSSPDAQGHPGKEKQTLRQVGEDQTLHWCLDEYDSYRLTSDPSQPHPLQTSRHLLHNHRDLIQDQTGLLHSHRDLIQDQTGVLHNHRDLIQDQTGLLHSHRDLIQDQTGLLHSHRDLIQDQTGVLHNHRDLIQDQRGVLHSHRDLIQEQTGLLHTAANSASCFCPQGRGQDLSSTAPPKGLPVKRLKPKDDSALLKSRLLCSVCQRDFRSLPALNGHMRSHSRSRSASWSNKGDDSSAPTVQPSVSMVMPVSVPVQSKACRSGQRRGSHLSPATGGAALLYRSLLHHREEEAVAEDGEAGDGAVAMGDGAHYTPPPMLCPIRVGPGLYCSLATRRQQKVQAVQLHNTHNGLSDLVSMETASPPPGTILNKPRINEGQSFQAEIPPLLGREHTDADPHNALLLWTPWDELERPVNRQRVEALMMMARSSVVPGGGASPESALHVLSECRGDFLLTVQKLLSTPETSDDHTAPHHQGVRWSAAERRMMVKSLHLHHKDFRRVHETVQTKSLSQCVEFYYLWKKKLSLIRRPPAGLTISLPNTKGQRSPGSHDAS